MPIPHRVEPPQRQILGENPQLRDHLIDYIVLRDRITKDLARKIIAAMDVHELTVLELHAREFRPANRAIDFEHYRYGIPEHPRELETDYHPFAR